MSLLERASSFQRSGFDRAPFVFSYDIHAEKVARAARRCLRRWRMDGQYSVHETVLTPSEAEALSVELIEIVDPETDSLIVFRLSRRGDGPIYSLSARATPRPFPVLPPPLPRLLHDGCYVVAYDVVDPRRLRRVQRVTSRQGLFLQRSVYLFSGEGVELARVLREAAARLEQGQDDLRVYALSGPDDLWFLCGATPPLAGLMSLQDRELPMGPRDRTGSGPLGGDAPRVLHPGSDGQVRHSAFSFNGGRL
jgi:CRISPR-associated endonuclease Cas2